MSNPTTITVNASAWARVTRERDEARDMVHGLRKQRAIARKFGEQMERERDEARAMLDEAVALLQVSDLSEENQRETAENGAFHTYDDRRDALLARAGKWER